MPTSGIKGIKLLSPSSAPAGLLSAGFLFSITLSPNVMVCWSVSVTGDDVVIIPSLSISSTTIDELIPLPVIVAY